jgi:hypothetical protein
MGCCFSKSKEEARPLLENEHGAGGNATCVALPASPTARFNPDESVIVGDTDVVVSTPDAVDIHIGVDLSDSFCEPTPTPMKGRIWTPSTAKKTPAAPINDMNTATMVALPLPKNKQASPQRSALSQPPREENITVPAGSTEERSWKLTAGNTLDWRWHIQQLACDIGFSVKAEKIATAGGEAKGSLNEQVSTIVSSVKHSSGQIVRGQWCCPIGIDEPTAKKQAAKQKWKITLVFDNAHSMFRSKEVLLRTRIESALERAEFGIQRHRPSDFGLLTIDATAAAPVIKFKLPSPTAPNPAGVLSSPFLAGSGARGGAADIQEVQVQAASKSKSVLI